MSFRDVEEELGDYRPSKYYCQRQIKYKEHLIYTVLVYSGLVKSTVIQITIYLLALKKKRNYNYLNLSLQS